MRYSMSILDKLAKAFGFKSDDDLKKKQEKEESKGASKKESFIKSCKEAYRFISTKDDK